MKIVVLTGSPHHSGTSEQLADAFVKGATEAGHQIYRFDAGRRAKEFSLLQLEDDHPGQEVAVEPEDVITTEVIPHLLEADLVVFVSSLYYNGINAALKAVIDRFYAKNHELHGGKRAITLVSGYGQPAAFDSLQRYFDQLLDYMRWPSAGAVLAADSWNQQKLATHVEEAYQLGMNLK